MSRYIARAEHQTGLKLFHRNRNIGKLILAGQDYLTVAKGLRSDLERYRRRVEQPRMAAFWDHLAASKLKFD